MVTRGGRFMRSTAFGQLEGADLQNRCYTGISGKGAISLIFMFSSHKVPHLVTLLLFCAWSIWAEIRM